MDSVAIFSTKLLIVNALEDSSINLTFEFGKLQNLLLETLNEFTN